VDPFCIQSSESCKDCDKSYKSGKSTKYIVDSSSSSEDCRKCKKKYIVSDSSSC
jgi:hypothetical protein